MYRIILAILCLIVLCCQPITAAQNTTVASPENNGGSEQLTRELMIKSGLNEQVENTPATLKTAVEAGFRRAAPSVEQLPQEVVDQIKRIISDSFKPELIRQVIAGHIGSQMSEDDIIAVLNWLDSPLGKKITHLEEIASTPEAYKEMMSMVPSLQKASDYDERIELMTEIDNSINATELMMDRMMNMQIVTITAMSTAYPHMNLPSVDMVKENFKKNRETISQSISREITLSALYTYRDVSKKDIETYIAFMKTEHGRKYHDVIHEGLTKAYAICGKEFGDAVGKLVQRKNKHRVEKTSLQLYPQEK